MENNKVPTLPILICQKCQNILTITFYFDIIKRECIYCGYSSEIELEELHRLCSKLKSPPQTCDIPQCTQVPIDFCIETSKWLCSSCLTKNKSTSNLDHYLYEIIKDVTICKIHNSKNEYYCGKCKTHFCTSCKNEHLNHKTLYLPTYFDNNKKDEAIKRVQNCKNEYDSYLKKIKNVFTKKFNQPNNQINTPDDIETLNQEIENNKIITSKAFNILEFIVNSYDFNFPIYPLAINALRNSDIIYYDMNFDDYDNEYSRDAGNDPFIYLQKVRIYIDVNFKMEDLSSIEQIWEIKENCNVIEICLYQNKKLALALDNNSINIYDIESENNFKLSSTIENIHDLLKYISFLPNGNLISCSNESIIYLYSPDEEGNYNKIIDIQDIVQQGINSLIIINDSTIAITENYNSKIFVYKIDYENKKLCLINTIEVGNEILSSYLAIDKYLIAAVQEKIIIYESKSFSKIKEITLECNVFTKFIDFEKNKIALVDGQKIVVINLNDMQIEMTINVNCVDAISGIVVLGNGNLLCGNSSGSLIEYDRKTYKLIQQKSTELEVFFNMILLKENVVLTSSRLESVNIWKID